MTAILEVSGLETGFGANQILHGVDFEVAEGRTAVLLGLNGAGKSVTLKTISGLQAAWRGSVRLAGRELVRLEAEDRIRAGLAHVLQSKAVFPALSVDENLRLGGAMVRDRQRFAANRERVFEIYPILADRASQLAGSLSGGEQAMLAVGRALMSDPRVLLVDEPSAGLSPMMVAQLVSTLIKVRSSGTSLLLVEQNVGYALELADDVFVLEKGRVVYQHKAKDLDQRRVASLLGIGELLGSARNRKISRPKRKPQARKRAAKPKKATTPRRRSVR
jgi:branched-chain amino acid transport system ATP-binding protein